MLSFGIEKLMFQRATLESQVFSALSQVSALKLLTAIPISVLAPFALTTVPSSRSAVPKALVGAERDHLLACKVHSVDE